MRLKHGIMYMGLNYSTFNVDKVILEDLAAEIA
jgi:hypothetical protein